jgi:uncharacterized protein YigE (DUF2233 family)
LAVTVHAASPEATCRTRTFEQSRFVVCRYRRGDDELRLMWRGRGGPLGGFDAMAKALGPEVRRVSFAMNAGMFDPAQAPVGLLVEAGRREHRASTGQGPGNFHLLPNGVFSVDADGSVHVEETRRFLARHAKAKWATQSGPLLLAGGALHPKIAEDGPSRLIRNGVGVSGPDQAWFVISEDPVSFGRFARLFRDELGCPDALYFDGSVSSLWAPALGRSDPGTGLGPLVVVLAKTRQAAARP